MWKGLDRRKSPQRDLLVLKGLGLLEHTLSSTPLANLKRQEGRRQGNWVQGDESPNWNCIKIPIWPPLASNFPIAIVSKNYVQKPIICSQPFQCQSRHIFTASSWRIFFGQLRIFLPLTSGSIHLLLFPPSSTHFGPSLSSSIGSGSPHRFTWLCLNTSQVLDSGDRG